MSRRICCIEYVIGKFSIPKCILKLRQLLIFQFIQASCDDHTTELPDEYEHGAQMNYGSGLLHQQPKSVDDEFASHGIGIVIRKPPPYNAAANPRFPGKQQPPYVNSDMHETHIGVRGDSWNNPPVGISKNRPFIPPPQIYEQEDSLADSHQHHYLSEPECDLKCDISSEYFCTKSCSCIHIDLKCGMLSNTFQRFMNEIKIMIFMAAIDGQADCGPDAEDEEDCEMTEEMIKKLKTDCEAIALSRHVMCPNTYICIKQDWLCGKLLQLHELEPNIVNYNPTKKTRWR